MSSPHPDVVEDCLLEDLSQKSWSPYPTLDAVSAFSTKYENRMECYAQQYDLHAESLLRTFSTQGLFSELAHSFIVGVSVCLCPCTRALFSQ